MAARLWQILSGRIIVKDVVLILCFNIKFNIIFFFISLSNDWSRAG